MEQELEYGKTGKSNTDSQVAEGSHCSSAPASQPPSARPRRLAEPGGETEGV